MQSLKATCLSLAGVEESHTHLLWLVAVVGLRWGHIISHWASPAPFQVVCLACACGRVETQQIKQEDPAPEVCSDISTAFLGNGEPQTSGPSCLSPQQLLGEEANPLSATSPTSPAECFDVHSAGPERPAPGLTTRQTPPPPPNKSPKLRQAPCRGVPAFPACRIRVKNSFSLAPAPPKPRLCSIFTVQVSWWLASLLGHRGQEKTENYPSQ